MTGGIHITPGAGVVINGIDVERVVGFAVEIARGNLGQLPVDSGHDATPREHGIAMAGAALLNKLRTKGYSKDICRDALWAKIIDEAQRVKA